MSSFKDKGVVL